MSPGIGAAMRRKLDVRGYMLRQSPACSKAAAAR